MKEEQIISNAAMLFTSFGIRNTSMQKLAKETGISTKTLYSKFPNKDSLVRALVEIGIQKDKVELNRVRGSKEFAIEELLIIRQYFFLKTKSLYPGLIEDLRKFYPDTYRLVSEFLETYRKDWLLENFQRGIKEGHYKRENNSNILSKYLIELTLMVLSRSTLLSDEIERDRVYTVLFENFMYGMTTAKGSQFLDEHFKKYFSI